MLSEQVIKEEKIKALDELFASSASYRFGKNFYDLLKFINKFPTLSPFNAFLIHTQNSGVNIVMSALKWEKRNRKVKFAARPMVILVPFGPVEFVYDIADTDGEDIPNAVKNPFATTGLFKEEVLAKTIHNCYKSDQIIYKEELMQKASAGFATYKEKSYKVTVNNTYDIRAKYSTLVHELGHIYAGHLGRLENSWWKASNTSSHEVCEIEAESISYLVCKRMGLETTSESYLSSYIDNNKEMPPISLDVILTVSGYIEQLGQPNFRPKKRKSI